MNKIFEDNNKQKSIGISPFIANRRRVKRISNNFFKQFIICFCLLFVLALIIYHNEIINTFRRVNTENSIADGKKWDFSLPFSAKSKNILLMGVDVSENSDRPFENTRSDSIYLITIPPYAKTINVISIPRDSKVYIHSKSSPDKINHAFAYGGVETSQKTIEQALGVKIDNYFVLSNAALVEFIDKIGGIDIYVEKNMKYHDYSANLHIDIEKGMRHLNGKEAEGYLRYRKDALGDIGRIRRQQWFLNALAEKLKDPGVLVKVPDIIKSLSKYIQTNLSLYEIAQYAALVKSMDSSRIRVATLPGEPSQRGAVSYWILDPEGVQDIVNKFVYDEKTKPLTSPVEAGILYVASEEQKAVELQKIFEAAGINTTVRQVKTLGHNHIAVHNSNIPNEYIFNLKNEIKTIKDFQTVYDTIGINKIGKDFTIVLAGS